MLTAEDVSDGGGSAAPARLSTTAGAVRHDGEIGHPNGVGVVVGVVLGRMTRWERRFQGRGIYTRLIGSSLCHQPVPKGFIGTGWSHQQVPKVFFSIPKGGKQRPLVPVDATNQYQ